MAFQGTLTGNLGKAPELKPFQSGKMKVELAVAVRQQDKNAEAFWVQVDPVSYTHLPLPTTPYV